MQTARELLKKLATVEVEPGDGLILSVYLDMRPDITGAKPSYRTALTSLNDRLRKLETTLLPRSTTLVEFRQDAQRVQDYIDNHAENWLQGLAIFACQRLNLFEVLETGVPFENQVVLEPKPDLFQLAHLIDEEETVVMALVDTNTARLFVSRSGFLEERRGPDENSSEYRQRRMIPGTEQKRYERRLDQKRQTFAREVAQAIETLIKQEGARRVVLAGDEVAIPILHRALSPAIEPMVHEEILRLDIRAPRNAVKEELRPVIEEMEAESSHSVADRLVEAVQAQRLGVVGEQETLDALEHGQVETLVLAKEASLREPKRAELVRLAALSGAEVESVQAHEALLQLGGVGGLLRYDVAWV